VSEPIRILVADDHPVVRDGLIAMLGTQPDFEVVGEASTGLETVERTRALHADIVLIDLAMPEMDGVEAIRQLRTAAPQTQAIVLTAFDSDERIVGALQAGAQGYLLKGAPRGEIFNAIRVWSAGGPLPQTAAASKLLHHLRAPSERHRAGGAFSFA